MGAREMRIETDLLGSIEIDAEAYYGSQTARALENFDVSDVRLHKFPNLINALAATKQATLRANLDQQRIDPAIAAAIDEACERVMAGEFHRQFVVDMVQGGAGTSTNMNANEVIANIALEIMGLPKGTYDKVHPNNHVNLSQSTNDVYPTAVRLAVINSTTILLEKLNELRAALRERGVAFFDIVKVGRTQLQDAVPMRLGQEFEAYAVTLNEDVHLISRMAELLTEVNLGGTAIGTSVNSQPGFGKLAVEHLSAITGVKLQQAGDLVEATSDTGAFVIFSSTLKRLAIKLSKLASDLRLLSSGPRAGLGEIVLPPMQAGSSIMPGKVNPVIPELINQIAFQIIGNDLTVTLAAEGGQLQLNAFEPIIAFNLLQSMGLLTRGIDTLTQRCIKGIEADAERCKSLLDGSLVTAAALNPLLGYSGAAALAHRALVNRTSLLDTALAEGIADRETLEALLDVRSMLGDQTVSTDS